MPTLHDLMTGSIDGRAARLGDAAPAGEARAQIGRRRRRNAALTGGTSTLAVGGLLAVGLALRTYDGDNDPASANPDAIAFATIPAVTEYGAGGSVLTGQRIGCGDTVPDSSASLEGFSLQTELYIGAEVKSAKAFSLDANTSVVSTLTYQGATHAPVFIDVGYGVLAKDGVVIAIVDQSVPRASLRFDPLIDGASWNDVANLGRLMLCDGSASAASDDPALAIGDYEFYTVAHAYVTQEAIGVDVLLGQGYGPAQPTGAWGAGSIDCIDSIASRLANSSPGAPPLAIPLACEPNAVPGAVINADAGTITVPYPAGDYTDDVAVTLVSPPMAIHLDQPLPYSGLGGWSSHDYPDSHPDTSALACGSPTTAFSSDVSVYATASGGLDSFTVPGGAAIQLDEWVDSSSAKVSLTSPTEAWFVGRSTYPSGSYILAHATATFTPSQDIVIDRHAGYPDVSLELTDLTWCGEVANVEPGQLIIKGAASVTGANGATSQGTQWLMDFK